MPSFNVQNAKSLEITEGDVATIHDADGRQLWGKLNYTTKYEGNTTQQTYSGKNQLDNTNTTVLFASGGTISENTVATIPTGLRYTCSWSGSGNPYALLKVCDLTPYKGKVVRMKSDFTAGGRFRLFLINQDASTRVQKEVGSVSGTAISFTVPDDLSTTQYLAYALGIAGHTGAETSVDYTNLIITIDNDNLDYEPYVGGIPSPNPDYPQPINVVTGTQTVTIAGGTVSQDFTVSLGSTELCKIGGYQDYIYKSNGNWYKHSEITKISLDGSNGWSVSYSGTANWFYRYRYINDIVYLTSGRGGWANNMCLPGNIGSTTTENGAIVATSGDSYELRVRYGTQDLSAWQTFLSTNNMIMYYVLATPTDTQITDTSLIAELDAIEEWMTRCGYTATISGNLPIVINQTEIV